MAESLGDKKMAKGEGTTKHDPELSAMAQVYAALKDLSNDGQERVLAYVMQRLSLHMTSSAPKRVPEVNREERTDHQKENAEDRTAVALRVEESTIEQETTEGIEGISPIAYKWMRRSGLTGSDLSALFSLGIEEIDLVAKSVPGESTKDRLRSVALLEGIASYLGTGVARTDYERLKQAATHYKADAGRNFWKYMKSLASEISGSSSSGFTLTARGLTSATDLIKEMLGKNKS